MNKGYRSNIIFHILSGFAIGLIIAISYYSSLFLISGKSFSFHAWFEFHTNAYISFLIDLLPFLGAFLASIQYSIRAREKVKYRELKKEDSIKIKTAISIAKGLSEGKFRNLKIDNPDQNELLHSLEQLKEGLIENKDSESKRKNEDKQRNWISEGIAKFGDILREESTDLNELSYILIRDLIRYLDANQGGFFITEINKEGKKYLNLLSSFAYNRKKFSDKQIAWGDGLTGTCAIEQKKIYMTDIPDSYLAISSGLGKSKPRNLLIVPLIHNNETKGIIELASFQEFQEYEIEFVEKIAESLAMALENIRNSFRTAQLLKETQEQTEELSIQEEKMRQSMVELKDTQEQAARQAEKFISFTNSVNHTLIRAEYDLDGILLYANTKFLKKLGYSGNREVEGKHISIFLNEKDLEWFNDMWVSLTKGGTHFEGYMKNITKQGQDLWTMATYTNIRNEEDIVDKVLFLAIDTTEQKKQSIDHEGQIEAINRLSLKAEFSPDGRLISSNTLFKNTLKYSESEFDQMNIFDFLDRKDIENLSETWEKVILGKAFQGQIRMLNKYREEKWFRATFTSVNDMYDEVLKVIFMANEITNEKIMEAESRNQTEQLKRQEEKFRIENLELNQKIKKASAKSEKEIAFLNKKINSVNRLIDLNQDIALIIDNSGIILHLNKKAEQLFNCSKKEIVNNHAMNLLNRENYPEQTEFIKTLFNPSQAKDFSTKMVNVKDKNGNLLEFNLHHSIYEVNDEVIYLILLKEN